jgi:hypothetical protein
MVERPPYIFVQGSAICKYMWYMITNKNPAQPAALLMLWHGGFGADWWGRDFGTKCGCVLCNKRRSHVIKNVVLLTWEKYYNYEKIQGVPVMSTTIICQNFPSIARLRTVIPAVRQMQYWNQWGLFVYNFICHMFQFKSKLVHVANCTNLVRSIYIEQANTYSTPPLSKVFAA